MAHTLNDLRRGAVTRTLFPPMALSEAIERLGFVRADPIRAPARAQDLILRQRAAAYRAGDLERQYAALGIEEDTFINYGFLPRRQHALMQPRPGMRGWTPSRKRKGQRLLEFVAAHGAVHPRAADAHFAHGAVTNYWGGSSSATTHLLEALHYAGLLRIVRREAGIRIYGVAAPPPPPDAAGRRRQIDALADLVVGTYAPVPAPTLPVLIGRLRYAVPQWRSELPAALRRARQRLSSTRVEGVDWYWPQDEALQSGEPDDAVRLLAPFDPIVWDRRRFELLWGWPYRFEAYTPVPKRKLGYYALPLLWRDRLIGWANVSLRNGALEAECGYVAQVPRDRLFQRELDAELDRMRQFLGVPNAP